MNQIPVAIGVHLCEQVIFEAETSNITLVNCFSSRRVEQFPATISFVVVAFLTDGDGEMPVNILIHRLDTFEEIYRHSTNVQFANPLRTVRLWLRIRERSFPIEGSYQVSLLIDGEPVARRRLAVLLEEFR